eukprot:5597293-Prymnesium_polylepis.1
MAGNVQRAARAPGHGIDVDGRMVEQSFHQLDVVAAGGDVQRSDMRVLCVRVHIDAALQRLAHDLKHTMLRCPPHDNFGPRRVPGPR